MPREPRRFCCRWPTGRCCPSRCACSRRAALPMCLWWVLRRGAAAKRLLCCCAQPWCRAMRVQQRPAMPSLPDGLFLVLAGFMLPAARVPAHVQLSPAARCTLGTPAAACLPQRRTSILRARPPPPTPHPPTPPHPIPPPTPRPLATGLRGRHGGAGGASLAGQWLHRRPQGGGELAAGQTGALGKACLGWEGRRRCRRMLPGMNGAGGRRPFLVRPARQQEHP